MSDWWDRHLGNQQAPPTRIAAPSALPGRAVSWQSQFPQVSPPPVDSPGPEMGIIPVPQKAAATRLDGDICPNCGSNDYSIRTMGVRRGPPPAPHCFQCGHNGMFDLEGTAASGADSQATKQFGDYASPGVDYSNVAHMQGFQPFIK